MVGRLVAIARAAGLADENVHDAVMLLDRLLRLGLSREAASPAVLAGVAVLSTKQGAPAPKSSTRSLILALITMQVQSSQCNSE